jgi:hypothetical protein
MFYTVTDDEINVITPISMDLPDNQLIKYPRRMRSKDISGRVQKTKTVKSIEIRVLVEKGLI